MELIAGFTAFQIAVAMAATLAAAFVRGLAGFGLAILLVPVIALALTPVEAVLVTNFVALFLGLGELRRLVAHAERSARTIAVLVLLTTAPGLIVLAATPAPIARLLIALVAISAFVAVLLPQRPAAEPSRTNTLLTGVSSGLLTGFAGMPGPPVIPYYVGRAIPRNVAKASMLLIFTTAALAGLGSGLAIGAMHWRLPLLALALYPVVLLGNRVGNRACGKISDNAWRAFTALVLGAAAAAAMIKLLQT